MTNLDFLRSFFCVFPWFVSFYQDVAHSKSGDPFGLGGLRLSPKAFSYFAGMQIIIASNANVIAAAAGIVSAWFKGLW